MGAEIQARFHFLSMGLEGCVFLEGCFLLLLTNVPYELASLCPAASTFAQLGAIQAPITREIISGLKEQCYLPPTTLPHEYLVILNLAFKLLCCLP